MTKEELINGNYWLITTDYPYQGCYTYDIIKSNSNLEEHSYFNEFIVQIYAKLALKNMDIQIIHMKNLMIIYLIIKKLWTGGKITEKIFQ